MYLNDVNKESILLEMRFEASYDDIKEELEAVLKGL